jgi:hypothetical protein
MSVSHNSRVAKLEVGLLLSLCENIGSSRALTCYLLAKSGEWQQLLDLSCNPDDYLDSRSFEDDYQVTSLLQKNPRLPLSIDRRAVAISKFVAAEETCAQSNIRLSKFLKGEILPPPDVLVSISHAQNIIGKILGPLNRGKLAFCESKMRFGPGATTSVSGVVTQGKKYSHRTLDATPRVVDFRTFCFPPLWKEAVRSIRVSHCSKLTTVPKNAKTDRVICIEPDLNIFVQLGIGALIREQLKLSGLDLDTQEWNRWLASQAIDLNLCTMDLSAASDTICREVVWTLLPFEWADLLHFARVDNTSINGKIVPLHKWSSMGNGYTFELESLLSMEWFRVVFGHSLSIVISSPPLATT